MNPTVFASPAVDRFIGMDLAWGTKARTGLAVLDGTGRLLDVTAARTDEEILSWCQSWIRASCLVAIDAPIVVPNDDGRRYCETLVSRYFGAYNAGAHSSNRSLPSFRDGSRGLRLARALGLEVDPASAAARRAIEVYPHPAIVMLFGLPAVLQYKARPGRSLETRRAELLRLVGYLDGLAAADPPLSTVEAGAWAQVRRAVEGATRPVDLERVEDVVDAVVCAYIALYASVRPGDVRVLGDVERGYILTPVTPRMAQRLDANSRTAAERPVQEGGHPRPAGAEQTEGAGALGGGAYVVVLSSAGIPRRVGGPFPDEGAAHSWAMAHSGPGRETVVLPLS